MRPKPKMLNRLPRILRSPQKQRITPRRRSQRQLIQRQTLTPSLLNTSASRSSETEGRDGEFGDGQEAAVVCDCAYDDESAGCGLELGGSAAGSEHGEAGEGEGGAVDAGHEEAAEDYFVEGGVGATCQDSLAVIFCIGCRYWATECQSVERGIVVGIKCKETYEPGSGRA